MVTGEITTGMATAIGADMAVTGADTVVIGMAIIGIIMTVTMIITGTIMVTIITITIMIIMAVTITANADKWLARGLGILMPGVLWERCK